MINEPSSCILSRSSFAFAYTLSSYVSTDESNCVSALSILRNDNLLPLTTSHASSLLYTSYGNAAILSAKSDAGRTQTNGLTVAILKSSCNFYIESRKRDSPPAASCFSNIFHSAAVRSLAELSYCLGKFLTFLDNRNSP